MRTYCAGVFQAELLSFEKAIARYRTSNIVRACDKNLPDIDGDIVPAFYDLACGLAHQKQKKACGEDLRGGEFYHAYPEELAETYLPLGVKGTALNEQPITFKGGQLHDLHKAGETDEVENYRDVLLADEVGKPFQFISRPQLNKVVSESVTRTQWGSGLNNGSTDVVHAYMNACVDIALARKQSIGSIFLDVKTAYANVQMSLFVESLDGVDRTYEKPFWISLRVWDSAERMPRTFLLKHKRCFNGLKRAVQNTYMHTSKTCTIILGFRWRGFLVLCYLWLGL